MRFSDFQIRNQNKLDSILVELCELILVGKKTDPKKYGMVAAAVLDPDNNLVSAINYPAKDGSRVHAERAALDAYHKKHGAVPEGSIIITTLSPCSEPMYDRYKESCTDLINGTNVRKVYCGYQDTSQDHSDTYQHKKFHTEVTDNAKIEQLCKRYADTFLNKAQLDELSFLGSPCTKDCSGHRAGYAWSQTRGGRVPNSWSQSFNNGAALQRAGK